MFAKMLANTLGAAVGFALSVGFELYMAFSTGYVLAACWRWFAMPRGAVAIGWPAFAALYSACELLRLSSPLNSNAKTVAGRVWVVALSPWVSLAAMWLFKP